VSERERTISSLLDALWLLNKDKPGNKSAFCDAILEAFKPDHPNARFLVNAYVYKRLEPKLLEFISEFGQVPSP
jgi:hypothetical protein